MTKDEALKLAIQALSCIEYGSFGINDGPSDDTIERAIQACRAALAQSKGLFTDMIAEHDGLSDELKAMDAAPQAPAVQPVKATVHTSVFDALPDSAYIREAQLVQRRNRPETPVPLPFSAPTLWRKVRQGTFPKPVKLSERVTAWNVGIVRAWIAAQTIT